MRTKEEILAEIHAYAGSTERWQRDEMIRILASEVLEHGFVPSEMPEDVQIGITDDTGPGEPAWLPVSFSPLPSERRWDIIVLHVLHSSTQEEGAAIEELLEQVGEEVRKRGDSDHGVTPSEIRPWHRPDDHYFSLIYTLDTGDEDLASAFIRTRAFMFLALKQAMETVGFVPPTTVAQTDSLDGPRD